MENQKHVQNSFAQGIRDGIPIGLGYLSVSFTFGMLAVAKGLPVWAAVAISMTNLTSAGQFAGLDIILASASYFEMALTQLIINMRYALMSVSMSQKLEKGVGFFRRLGIAFGITDEIFAVATTQEGFIGTKYTKALLCAPYIGWTLGTLLGAVAGKLLPSSFQSALGIAIYGMFIAIIIPAVKKSLPVFVVVLIAVAMSCLFRYIPCLSGVSGGFVIIICAVVAAAVGALWRPLLNEEESQ